MAMEPVRLYEISRVSTMQTPPQEMFQFEFQFEIARWRSKLSQIICQAVCGETGRQRWRKGPGLRVRVEREQVPGSQQYLKKHNTIAFWVFFEWFGAVMLHTFGV